MRTGFGSDLLVTERPVGGYIVHVHTYVSKGLAQGANYILYIDIYIYIYI